MNQIPSGEYCWDGKGRCPCYHNGICQAYPDEKRDLSWSYLSWDGNRGYKRLPVCVSRQPQVVEMGSEQDQCRCGKDVIPQTVRHTSICLSCGKMIDNR